MSPLVFTVILHSANRQPDCRLLDAGVPDVRMDYFFSRAAYRLIGAVERVLLRRE